MPNRLYKEFLDDRKYQIALLLVQAFPKGMGAGEIGKALSWPWSTTIYHIRGLLNAHLIRQIPSKYKRPVYALTSRALFEYGIIEKLLSRPDGVECLAEGLAKSMEIRHLASDMESLRRLARFTEAVVRLKNWGMTDELRESFVRNLQRSRQFRAGPLDHNVHSEDVARLFIHDFIHDFLTINSYRRRFAVPIDELSEGSIKRVLNEFVGQLSTEDPHPKPQRSSSRRIWT